MFGSLLEKGLLLPFGESVKTKTLIFDCRCRVGSFPRKGQLSGGKEFAVNTPVDCFDADRVEFRAGAMIGVVCSYSP